LARQSGFYWFVVVQGNKVRYVQRQSSLGRADAAVFGEPYNSVMATNHTARYVQPYPYASPNIPLAAIRRFARQIAERFHPEKIILFGSYAYGTPHNESDVDLLVIMPAYDVVAQAIRISGAFERLFSHSIIVRTPQQIKRGMREDDRDWFLYEVMTKGKVLYEATHRSVGSEGRGRHRNRQKPRRARKTKARRSLLPLPAGRRKVSQGPIARARPGRSKNA
jgi:predicted nucleotidyltransferase